MTIAARFLLLLLLISLGACGGGGGGSSSAQNSDSGGSNGGGDTGNGGDGSGDNGASGHRVAGSVHTERFSDTDSDSNDPGAPSTPNNSPDQAQALGNPVVLGGFASAEGSGEAGHRFQSQGDDNDWFRLPLSGGQSIRLTIHEHQLADALSTDLDLYLYDPTDTGNPVASSTGITSGESIQVPESGDYLLRVHAKAGISGYTLQIDSSDDRGGLLSSPSIGNDFAPGELIVRWKRSTGGGQVRALAGAEGERPRRYRLADASAEPPRLPPLQRTHPRAGPRALRKLRTLMELKALQADAAVEYAEPNYRYRALRAPSDPLYLRQWHYRNIHLPEAWDITTGSGDAIVAVLDTGIFSGHPDFENKLVDGYDFISDAESARDGDGIDSDPEDEGDLALQNRSSWHGTHVAGTAGALTDNGAGVSGVGWQTRIMPLRVLGVSGGNSYDTAQAVRYAAGLENDSGTVPARRADVINMSFGGSGLSQTLQDAISDARATGVLLVAAAGNDNGDTPIYPAAMKGVIAVSATDFNDDRAPYSNFGDWVDLAAPGGDMTADADGDGFSDGVLSTHVEESVANTAGYARLQGTSMASPHAAGVFALMKAANPDLTPDDLDALLIDGQLTRDLGESGRDPVYGHGLLDAYKAVQAAGQEVTEPVISADPEVLNFAGVHTELQVEIRNLGADGASVSGSPLPGADWITGVQTTDDVDASGFGTYRVSVNRSDLSDGIYNSEVVFPMSGTDDYRLPVNMEVGSSSSGHYAGHLYILLVKPVGDGEYETLQQLSLSTDNGEYPFEFTGIEPGDYVVAAGSDLNANGTICDPGRPAPSTPPVAATASHWMATGRASA
ncbi:S8 family serine peptidase [Microbulbifer taiwanensis]|uniref:S8 family serine peptidase n=1 Tax=Microbulbifer taiwanensis TaxID=986746 RepID=UPI00360E9866